MDSKEKNRIYNDLKADKSFKNITLDKCIEKIKEDSLPSDDRVSLRRIEMKKKEYGDVLKKVAVASFSLIATGAIIIGVSNYKDGKKGDYNRMVSKTTESVTKKVNSNDKDETKKDVVETVKEEVEEKNNINPVENKLEYLDFEDRDTVEYSVDDTEDEIIEKNKNNTSYAITTMGEYELKKIYTDDNKDSYDLYIKKGSEEYKKIGRYNVAELTINLCDYKYGYNLYLYDDEGIVKINLKTLKPKYIMKYKDINLSKFLLNPCKIDDKFIYFFGQKETHTPGEIDSEAWDSVQFYMYVYNIKTKEIKFIGNRYCEDIIDDDYIVTSEVPKYKYETPGHPFEKPLYLEKFEGGKLKEVKKLGERAYCTFMGDLDVEEDIQGLHYSNESNHKFFYQIFKKTDALGLSDSSEITIMSYDIDNDKMEKVADLSAKKLKLPYDDIFIETVNDEYIVFKSSYFDEKKVTTTEYRYKYYYKTKKLEQISKKVI